MNDDTNWIVNNKDIIVWPKNDAIWGSKAAMDKIVQLEQELENLTSQRDELLAAAKLVKDYEEIYLNGGIGRCIAIKTKALDDICAAISNVEGEH